MFVPVIHFPFKDELSIITFPVIGRFKATIIRVFNAPNAVDNLLDGILKFGFKVLGDGVAEGFACMEQYVAHHDEHNGVTRRAGVAGRGIESRAVAKVNFKHFVRAHVEFNSIHFCCPFVVAFVGEFIADGDVEFAHVKAKFFHGQTRQVHVVIG